VILSGTDTPKPKGASAPGSASRATPWRSLAIVVADDEADTVKTLKAILEDEGHRVRAVYNSSDVMAAVRNFQPDAVLLDIAMPGLSGYDVAKQIRTWFVSYRPLLIAISGVYTKGTDAFLSKAVGFDHHLTKPCIIDELLFLLEPLTKSTR
jgi:CheY-like chemotaxis protein